ncbi:hypothetical protein L1049_000305 [Liquidambar formosana]|uniref:J domain-containing protein n=1 Tax=Liquidambar formosana TaxID=63359 RepID=A0AAP0NAS8_LIQFO
MSGALTLPTTNSLLFSPGNRFPSAGTTRSDRKMSFAWRNLCRASVQTFPETAGVINLRKPASLYEVLRVKQNASPMEIKTAYRTLAKMYHPDAAASESDGRDFIELHNAYSTLSDPAARAVYDLSLGVGGRSFGYSAGNRSQFYTTRRWETDQCW